MALGWAAKTEGRPITGACACASQRLHVEGEQMGDKKTYSCIGCPNGCPITIAEGPGRTPSITGNRCERGRALALSGQLGPCKRSPRPYPSGNRTANDT